MAVVLSKSAAKRIVAATRKVEQTPTPMNGRGQPAQVPLLQFWAVLGSEDPANPGRYAFTMKVPKGLDLVDPPAAFTTASFTAIEVNGTAALTDQKAWLTFVSYDTSTPPKPVYFFSAGGGGIGNGTVQYTVRQVVTANTDGYDYIFSHP